MIWVADEYPDVSEVTVGCTVRGRNSYRLSPNPGSQVRYLTCSSIYRDCKRQRLGNDWLEESR